MERSVHWGLIMMPREFIVGEISIDRGNLLLLYSYLYRYATFDGLFYSSIEDICKNLGSTFDKKKNRHVPVLAKKLIEGLDYLCAKQVISLEHGDYNEIRSTFTIQIDSKYLNIKQNYISISFANFDYILEKSGKEKKANIFLLLYWILNVSTKNDDGKIINACSYSIMYMSKRLSFSPASICRYLRLLCGNKNTSAPLIRFKYSEKLDNGYRAFANTYVKNDKNATTNFEQQKDFIIKRFGGIKEVTKKADFNMDYVQDIDDFYEY